MSHRATLCLLSCMLSLVTAVTLVLASAAVGTSRLSAPSPRATEATVRAFYDTVNTAIRTGDVSALESMVAPAFVDHAPAPAMTPDRAGLAEYLGGVHATYPDAEIFIDEIVAVGDQALVWTNVRGAENGAFAGLPLAGDFAVWGKTDVFRVVDRRISERWGSTDQTMSFAQLGEARVTYPLLDRQGIAFERHTWEQGEYRKFDDPDEAWVLSVETGTLSVAVASQSTGPALLSTASNSASQRLPVEITPGTELSLVAGDVLVLPKLAQSTIGNVAASPATALVAAMFTPGAPERTAPRADPAYGTVGLPTEVRQAEQVLAGERLVTLPAEPQMSIAFGRMTLAPDASLSLGAALGSAMLYVDSGTLDLQVESGDQAAWVRRWAIGSSNEMAAGALYAGDGALLQPETMADLRNASDAPLTLLVVTILPDSA